MARDVAGLGGDSLSSDVKLVTGPSRKIASQNTCTACGSQDLSVFLELFDLPAHVGIQWPSRDAARNCPRGAISLALCQGCGLIANIAYDPNRLDYRHSYDNSLDVSPLYRDYAQRLAKRLINTYDLHDTTVIEVGCGRGEFLRLLCEIGNNQGIGFDPNVSAGGAGRATDKRIKFIGDYYSHRYAEYQGDLICCRHVFEHIPEPGLFLTMLRDTVGDKTDTVLYFEVPNARYVLDDLAVWTIIYEHCSYFSSGALAYLFASRGFTVRRLYECYEGQFLGIEAVPSQRGAASANGRERDTGSVVRAVESFSLRYARKVSKWRADLAGTGNGRGPMVVWGAGARAVSFLNILGITDRVPYVVDINPQKAGKYLPGTGQQIVSPAFLRDYQPGVVIIMNDIYSTEIQQHIEQQLGLSVQYIYA